MAYRGASYCYTIRKIAEVKDSVVFGITIPTEVAMRFSGVSLNMCVIENNIILSSGTKVPLHIIKKKEKLWYNPNEVFRNEN